MWVGLSPSERRFSVKAQMTGDQLRPSIDATSVPPEPRIVYVAGVQHLNVQQAESAPGLAEVEGV